MTVVPVRMRAFFEPPLALAVCAVGGAAFQFLKAPLPWMIGPLLGMAMLKLSGLRLSAPRGGRQLGQLVIGTALGLYFTPQVAHQVLGTWPVLIAAALHWPGDHPTLFKRLCGKVAAGGVLAVQMPRNFGAPSHTLMHELAASPPWRYALAKLLRPQPVLAPEAYYGVMAPNARTLDIWETEYLQVLEGDNPVAEWTKGTWLAPLLAALAPDARTAFESEYRRRVVQAYPPQPDGKTLFPFRRLFMVAGF